MTLEQIKQFINTLPEDCLIYVNSELNVEGDWEIEPITESCENETVIGFVLLNKSVPN